MNFAVIGGGVIGLTAASELLRAGHTVDIFDVAPGLGASNGNSRIWRQSHDDPRMVEVSVENAELWQEWENRWGKQLLNSCGLFYSGKPAKRRYELLQKNDIPAEWKEPGEVLPNKPGLWEKGAGAIFCPQVFAELLRETKGHIIEEMVQRVEGARIETLSGWKSYDRVVATAGEGMLRLFPEWSEDISLQAVPHMRIDFLLRGTSPPAWIDHKSGKYGVPGRSVYSIGGSEQDALSSEKNILHLASALQKSLDPQPMAYTICSSLRIGGSDEGWRAASREDIVLFAGGNSYKWAPLHGKQIAAMATGNTVSPLWMDIATGE